MIISNNKPIRIIGYTKSSMTQEFLAEIQKTHSAEVITPDGFFKEPEQDQYQYIVSVSWDLGERKTVIDHVDQHGFDLITVIHDSAIVGTDHIGPGSFVFGFSTAAIGSKIGRHSIIGYYSLVGHHSCLGNNCILRPGVMINGKSTVGNNCVINSRVTVTNGSTVADNIELMAFTNVAKDLTSAGRYIGPTAKKISQQSAD
jgi:UDP-3-O-[3-hydroxymyristoyl] glucosamine N-acyltransferase